MTVAKNRADLGKIKKLSYNIYTQCSVTIILISTTASRFRKALPAHLFFHILTQKDLIEVKVLLEKLSSNGRDLHHCQFCVENAHLLWPKLVCFGESHVVNNSKTHSWLRAPGTVILSNYTL